MRPHPGVAVPLVVFLLASLLTPAALADWDVPAPAGTCLHTMCRRPGGEWYRRSCGQSCSDDAPAPGASSGSDWNDLVRDVGTARAFNDTAAHNLGRVAAVLATLDAYSRALVEGSLSADERASVSAAHRAVTERFQQAAAANRSLGERIVSLESEVARLRSRLSALEAEEEWALGEIVRTREALGSLRERIERLREWQALAEAEADVADSLAREGASLARDARRSYWARAAAFFDGHALGRPRDYMSPVTAPAAHTQRRTLVSGLYQPAPALAPAAPLAARAASIPAVAAAAAAPPALVDRDAFLAAVADWRRALDQTAQLETYAAGLIAASQDRARQIGEKAAAVSRLRPEMDEAEQEESALRAQAASAQLKLERTVASARVAVEGWLESSREMLAWQVAEEALQLALAPAAAAAARVNLVRAVGAAYGRLLQDEIPAALELLASADPSDEAIERYEGLLHLESTHAREVLAAAYFSSFNGFDGAPRLSRPRLRLDVSAAGERAYVTQGGWRLAQMKRGDPLTSNVRNFTRVAHVMSHTEAGVQGYMYSPPFRRFLDVRMAKGREHGVFDVAPSALLDLIDDVGDKYRAGLGVPEVRCGPGRRCFVIDMGRVVGRTGARWGADPAPGVPTRHVMFVLEGEKDVVSLYPVRP